MKAFISAALLLASGFAYGEINACIGEARIVTSVYAVEQVSASACKLIVTGFDSYEDNDQCSLDTPELLSKGIDIKTLPSGACPYQAGDMISGIAFTRTNGEFSLRK